MPRTAPTVDGPARRRRRAADPAAVAGRPGGSRRWRDDLTGLWTRAGLETVLGPTRLADPAGTAVVLLDLADFDGLNLGLGRQAGDRVLVESAARLCRDRRPGDVVARLDGDVFAVVAAGVRDQAAAARLAAGLVERWAEPVTVGGVDVLVEVAAGVAHAPSHGTGREVVLARAAAALHRAKARRTTTALYQPGEDEGPGDRLSLVSDLARALAADRLSLVYQPLVDLGTGRVRSLEALARWDDPVRGPVPPAAFVPAAEHTGLARPLARWALHRALADCAGWRRSGLPAGVSVNVSAAAARDDRLVETVADALVRSGLPGDALTMEITEWVLVEPSPEVRATLEALRRLGVRVAIDDFGTGYSSVAYLKELPIDQMKIDGSFVTNLLTDTRDRVIVESVARLGTALGVEVVAEGIEDRRAVPVLAELGCTGQGYALCRPGPADAVVAWCRSDGRRAAP